MMVDEHTEALKSALVSTKKAAFLWPFLATILVFPVIAIAGAFLLLWFVHSWNVPAWALILLSIPMLTIGAYTLWRWMRSWADRRFRISLRGMLFGMTVVALVLGTVGRGLLQLFRHEQAVWNIAASGGLFDSGSVDNNNWLEARIGYDPLDGVKAIQVRTDQVIPTLLQNPEPFGELQHLSFRSGATDASLKYTAELNRFPKLDSAAFISSPLTDSGMRHLEN